MQKATMRPNLLFWLQAYSLHSNNLSMSFFFIQIYVKCCHIFLGFLVMQTLYANKVFSIPSSTLNIWEFAARIYCGNLPQYFAVAICCRNLARAFYVCNQILPCICKQILFICKQNFFYESKTFLFKSFLF